VDWRPHITEPLVRQFKIYWSDLWDLWDLQAKNGFSPQGEKFVNHSTGGV